MDEAWVHQFKPETEEQSKQWKPSHFLTPKKSQISEASSKGVTACIFLGCKCSDACGCQTFTGTYLLRLSLEKAMREKQDFRFMGI